MQRVTDRRIAQARFSQKKYIDNFDWNHPTKIDVDLVRYLFLLKFLEGDYKKNVAFIGLCGLGKTHLMRMRPASPMVRRKRDFFEWEFTKKMNAVGL